MRIFVISDTHIPGRIGSFPKEIIKKIKSEDILFHCGDFTSIDVYRRLGQMCRFYGVYGNMDDYALRSELPKQQFVKIKGITIGLIHGWGSPVGLDNRVYEAFSPKPDVILFGHSHSKMSKKIKETLLFNPGAVAGSWNESPSYGELFVENGGIWGEHFDLEII